MLVLHSNKVCSSCDDKAAKKDISIRDSKGNFTPEIGTNDCSEKVNHTDSEATLSCTVDEGKIHNMSEVLLVQKGKKA